MKNLSVGFKFGVILLAVFLGLGLPAANFLHQRHLIEETRETTVREIANLELEFVQLRGSYQALLDLPIESQAERLELVDRIQRLTDGIQDRYKTYHGAIVDSYFNQLTQNNYLIAGTLSQSPVDQSQLVRRVGISNDLIEDIQSANDIQIFIANQEFLQAANSSLKLLFASVILTMFLAGSITIYAGWSMRTRLAVLTRFAEGVRQRDFGRPIDPEGKDEIAVLAVHLKSMAETIKTSLSQLERDKAHNLHLAQTDPLTGLGNRRALEERLAALLNGTQTFALVFIDLDNFKRVNDTYGHIQGDEVLKDFSLQLSSLFRSSDQLFRIGGDEFVVCSPNAFPEDFVKRFSLAVQKLFSTHPELSAFSSCDLGATMGVANFQPIALPAVSLEEKIQWIMDRADALMYDVKRRNKHGCMFSDFDIPQEVCEGK